MLWRAGYNFFWETFQNPTTPVLGVDFYVSAGIFFVLWSAVLVISFCRRLQRGLSSEIATLASDMAQQKLTGGLFPRLEEELQQIAQRRGRLDQLGETCRQLRSELATSPDLGSARNLNSEPVGSA